jgi:CTP:molybdopterin cytidylyltransferase MocA
LISKAGDVVFAESKVGCATNVMAEPNNPQRLDTAQQDTPAFLLVGGLGTRLQSVLPSTPKPLARVGNMPFLELLVLQLRSQGIRRIVMCTGHLASQIEQEFGDGHKWDVAINYSQELQPLGTAGAVKLAEGYVKQASDFLVMNGDSFLELDLREFIQFHREHGGLVSLAVRKVPDAARYGTVHMDSTALCWTRCLRVRRALKRMCFRECSNRACTLSSSTACSLISARPKITLEPRCCARAFIRQLRLIRDWS